MANQDKAFEFGPFRLDVRERRLTRDGHCIPLRGRVFDTLNTLVSRHGCLVTKDELMAAVWPDTLVEETNLNHNICVLRRALGEKVTGQKYIETVPRQGYRFVAEVRELDDLERTAFQHASAMNEAESDQHESHPDPSFSRVHLQSLPPTIAEERRNIQPVTRSRWYLRYVVISTCAVTFLAVAGYFGLERFGPLRGSSDSRKLVVVLPFENLTGDLGQQYVADGLSHEIIAQLGRWNPRRVGVIARTSSSVYQGVRKSVNEIGRELGVDYIVEGSVRRSEGTYRVTVMLISVDDQAHLWAANYDRPVDQVMTLQVELAKIISGEIGSRINVDAEGDSHGAYPPTPQAFALPSDRTTLRMLWAKTPILQSSLWPSTVELLNQDPAGSFPDRILTVSLTTITLTDRPAALLSGNAL
jgi:TolB-like protein/DNA-binding winged helix-turn-helix (wHTH) protein